MTARKAAPYGAFELRSTCVVVSLTRTEFAIWMALGGGQDTSYDVLSMALDYGTKADASARNAIRVQVCKLRAKVAQLGYRIASVRHIGYRLETSRDDA